jgi:hypothetical protein
MTGEPSDDDAALSGSLCDRCNTTQCPQSMVVSLPARWLGSRTLSDLRPERSTLRFATLHSARSARQHPQTVGRMVQEGRWWENRTPIP